MLIDGSKNWGFGKFISMLRPATRMHCVQQPSILLCV